MGGGEERGRGGMFVSEVYAARLFTTPRSAGRVEREMVFLLRNNYRVNSTPHTLSLSPFYTLHLHCGSAFSLLNNNTFTNTTVMKQALCRIL